HLCYAAQGAIAMRTSTRVLSSFVGLAFFGAFLAVHSDGAEQDGFVSLFNGQDFTNWKVPEDDNGHWKIVDGVIDYDAQSEAKGDKNLWSAKEYGDFTLRCDWRIKETPYLNP